MLLHELRTAAYIILSLIIIVTELGVIDKMAV